MKNKSPQSTPSTSQSPNPAARESGQNPSPGRHPLEEDLQEVAGEVEQDLEDAARKKLDEEIVDRTGPEPSRGS